ncbi:hypothetical protein [Polymorphobacter sp.]|uniref:hypothetical protein n=1 Tax=Polymorphobacter sp. TaxID=1909290 RepID=UPI003F7010DC
MAKSGNRPLQRARLGVTGLAAVFLLVLAAAVLVRPEAGRSAVGHQAQAANAEPLAVLGLAPTSHRDNTVSSSDTSSSGR